MCLDIQRDSTEKATFFLWVSLSRDGFWVRGGGISISSLSKETTSGLDLRRWWACCHRLCVFCRQIATAVWSSPSLSSSSSSSLSMSSSSSSSSFQCGFLWVPSLELDNCLDLVGFYLPSPTRTFGCGVIHFSSLSGHSIFVTFM